MKKLTLKEKRHKGLELTLTIGVVNFDQKCQIEVSDEDYDSLLDIYPHLFEEGKEKKDEIETENDIENDTEISEELKKLSDEEIEELLKEVPKKVLKTLNTREDKLLYLKTIM